MVYAISESSPVRLGLAAGLVLGTGSLVWQVASIRGDISREINGAKDEINKTYVTEKLFNARMDEMARAIHELRAEVRNPEGK
jgi:hypothetical protein